MAELIDSVAGNVPAGFAFRRERRANLRASSVSESSEDFESFTIPSRGIVVAVLVSAVLWAGIFLGGHALWLLIR
jgi:hypothetical protein